jgi:simple sugar transport system permease protein
VLSISGTPIPSEFMMMLPYIATIIAVSGFVGKVRAPAADGIPYKRGGGSR